MLRFKLGAGRAGKGGRARRARKAENGQRGLAKNTGDNFVPAGPSRNECRNDDFTDS